MAGGAGTLGLIIVGALLQGFDWTSIFWFSAVLAPVALVATLSAQNAFVDGFHTALWLGAAALAPDRSSPLRRRAPVGEIDLSAEEDTPSASPAAPAAEAFAPPGSPAAPHRSALT